MWVEKARWDLILVERALNTAFELGCPQDMLVRLEYRRRTILAWLLEEQLREFDR